MDQDRFQYLASAYRQLDPDDLGALYGRRSSLTAEAVAALDAVLRERGMDLGALQRIAAERADPPERLWRRPRIWPRSWKGATVAAVSIVVLVIFGPFLAYTANGDLVLFLPVAAYAAYLYWVGADTPGSRKSLRLVVSALASYSFTMRFPNPLVFYPGYLFVALPLFAVLIYAALGHVPWLADKR
jgi:hypothetical protein